MKKQLLIIALFLCCGKMTSNAQVWFDLGVKGGWGLTNLYNTNVSNDRLYKYKLNTGFKYGGKFGLNFGDHNGIAFEGLMAQNNQKWQYTTTSGNTNGVDTLFNNNISWKALDIYVLYRYMNDRSYIELGPKLTRVGKIKQTDDKLPSVTNVSPYYSPQLVGACLGFGGYLGGTNTFSTQLGIRLEYAFTDLISAAGQEKGYPNPIRRNPTFYETYASTNALSAQITLEFNFGVGGYAEAACGRRGFFLFKND